MNAKQIYDQLKEQFEINKRTLAKQAMLDDLRVSPLAAGGTHGGMPRAAKYAADFNLDPTEAFKLLQEANNELNPPKKP